MKYLTREKSKIINLFKQIKTFQDLSDLLEVDVNWFKKQLFKVPLEEKYILFTIPKRNGEQRQINSSILGNREIQARLNEVLRLVYETERKDPVHGFTTNRNIITNARNHCNKKFVLNIDIKDFFPTITQQRIRGVLMSPPYNLSSIVATTISHICCYEGKLPQGAPTSPIISNMVCAKLDSQLRLLAKKNRCFYTRYADDITFSTTANNFPPSIAQVTGSKITDVSLSKDLICIFESNGFNINLNKIRIQKENQRQEVTGLTVNNKPNVSRKYIKKVRAMIHDWHTNGYVQAYINNSVIAEKQNKKVTQFAPALRGKIEFIGQVRSKDDCIYKNLLLFYNKLIERDIIRQRSLNFDVTHYSSWCETVDKYVTAIIKKYINSKNISTEDIKKGFDELNKLKQGKDPNYDLPGVPVAYAFLYLPRKIIAMTAVLSHYFKDTNTPIPNRLLDVGSGTDAVSIALGLFRENINLTITAIEPCSYMRQFAMFKPNFPNLEISNVSGSIGSWFQCLNYNYYHLICMSSILQNSFRSQTDAWWLEWTQDLYEASTKNARLIMIEPHVKAGLVSKMKWAMESSGWILKEQLLLSDLFPQVSNKERILQQLTSLKEELIGKYWQYSVVSWNGNKKYNEYIHIYYKNN